MKKLVLALNRAIAEHRWNDAYILLPVVSLSGFPSLPNRYFWKTVQLIISNLKDCSRSTIENLTKTAYNLSIKPQEICIDHLALTMVTCDKTSELESALNTYEYYEKLNNCYTGGLKHLDDEKHINVMLSAYRGLIAYVCYKNECSAMNYSVQNGQPSQQFGDSATNEKRLLVEAVNYLNFAYNGLTVPCDWLLQPYLDCITLEGGIDQALDLLDKYVEKHNDQATAHVFAYNYLKSVSKSCDRQQAALEKISQLWPNHPLVLEYVNCLLNIVSKRNKRRSIQEIHHQDSGLEESSDEDNKDAVHTQMRIAADLDDSIDSSISTNCIFITADKTVTNDYTKECLLSNDKVRDNHIEAFEIICRLIEYPNWNDKLQAWEKLSYILSVFYRAWLRCWNCVGCKSSRRKLATYRSDHLCPMWNILFFNKESFMVILEKEKALLTLHRAYAAHVLSADECMLDNTLKKLHEANEYLLHKQLLDMTSFEGAYKAEFKELQHNYFSRLKKKSKKRKRQLSVQRISLEYQDNSSESYTNQNSIINNSTPCSKAMASQSLLLSPIQIINTTLVDDLECSQNKSKTSSRDFVECSVDESTVSEFSYSKLKCLEQVRDNTENESHLNLSNDKISPNMDCGSNNKRPKKSTKISNDKRKINEDSHDDCDGQNISNADLCPSLQKKKKKFTYDGKINISTNMLIDDTSIDLELSKLDDEKPIKNNLHKSRKKIGQKCKRLYKNTVQNHRNYDKSIKTIIKDLDIEKLVNESIDSDSD